ncbi:unnamed protein product [Gongylonema pulchrum]|uniref:Protein kinase domain-containing protein n=1 Tax=Gongylonema pulchrum TaxID=637853 RepID=A0A183EKA5_9BILA|nr:unnamed protein product [Gongylonema pulchrum]
MRQSLPNKLLSPACAARVAVHTLYQIKQIHEIGYILRDLKIGDMLLGLSGKETKMIFLVDFGMCRTYIKRETNGSLTIRPPREKAFVRGILRYCSPRVHKRQDVCRADDLWSLVYILVDLTTGLPWRDKKAEKVVADLKEKANDKELFDNCPQEWLKIMEHIRSLKFESRPDYKLVYKCLQETLVRFQASYSDPWDWDLVGNNVIVEEEEEESDSSSSSSKKIKKETKTDVKELRPESDQDEERPIQENRVFIIESQIVRLNMG